MSGKEIWRRLATLTRKNDIKWASLCRRWCSSVQLLKHLDSVVDRCDFNQLPLTICVDYRDDCIALRDAATVKLAGELKGLCAKSAYDFLLLHIYDYAIW